MSHFRVSDLPYRIYQFWFQAVCYAYSVCNYAEIHLKFLKFTFVSLTNWACIVYIYLHVTLELNGKRWARAAEYGLLVEMGKGK